MKQLLVLSGKGGTGKTTLVSSFIELGGFKAFADCDVDAPNLYLISGQKGISPIKSQYFGMDKVEIDSNKCIKCGLCKENCRFDAIEKTEDKRYKVNHYNCEGCGVCLEFCPEKAIYSVKNQAGETEIFPGDYYLSTAKLKMGEGNSGLLVSKVKENLKKNDAPYGIVDGSPGIGCPVIASISGVDMVIVVTEPSLSGLSDLNRIVEMTGSFGIEPYIVINKYDINIDKTNEIKEWCKDRNLQILGLIPFDGNCNNYINNSQPLVNSPSAASEEIKKIHKKALRILNELK